MMSNGHPTIPSLELNRIFETRGPSGDGGGMSTSGAHPPTITRRTAQPNLGSRDNER
jgi:hypothetical protein